MIRRAAFIERFLLPLVEGGEVHVGAPLGFAGLARMADEPGDTAAERLLSTVRWRVARELLVRAVPPSLDEESLRLGIALHDLLFLFHPEAPDASRVRRRRFIAAGSAALATLDLTSDPDELVARHTILHRLSDLGRDDVRISFWVGKREFHGQLPPARLTAWPKVRKVTEERWRVSCLEEAVGDVTSGTVEVVRALLRSSPLTDLLDPLRAAPPFDLIGTHWDDVPRGQLQLTAGVPRLARAARGRDAAEKDEKDEKHEDAGEDGYEAEAEVEVEVEAGLDGDGDWHLGGDGDGAALTVSGGGGAGLRAALADPEVCRLVAYQWLELGIQRTGPRFASVLVRHLGAREPDDLRFCLSLLSHLHLCLVLGAGEAQEVMRAASRGDEGARDFVGLFAALYRTAPELALPADLRRPEGPPQGDGDREPAGGAGRTSVASETTRELSAAVREHAATCATLCGAVRLRELSGLIARTLDVAALAV